ncbi:MAG TPA: CDP-diacylglycerol--serine O-phosphatidyltransferase [Porphyromonadaceae bacterium]|nr:CDP-diacylglycerol--serine O-phosphatidyltransferase [Porphyromonadaceae bacterium]
MIRRNLPNLLTSLNLLCGIIASSYALQGKVEEILPWFLGSILCDFFDGFVARLLKVSSAIGKELDSLADMVSFGLMPGWLVLSMMGNLPCNELLTSIKEFLPFVALLLPVFSALRLAKFNIDTRQTHSFIGLPTPANALFWLSFVWYGLEKESVCSQEVVLLLVLIFSLLMVCELPMFSLKIKGIDWKENRVLYLFLLLCIGLLIYFKSLGPALCIVCYILICGGEYLYNYLRNRQ